MLLTKIFPPIPRLLIPTIFTELVLTVKIFPPTPTLTAAPALLGAALKLLEPPILTTVGGTFLSKYGLLMI